MVETPHTFMETLIPLMMENCYICTHSFTTLYIEQIDVCSLSHLKGNQPKFVFKDHFLNTFSMCFMLYFSYICQYVNSYIFVATRGQTDLYCCIPEDIRRKYSDCFFPNIFADLYIVPFLLIQYIHRAFDNGVQEAVTQWVPGQASSIDNIYRYLLPFKEITVLLLTMPSSFFLFLFYFPGHNMQY